MKKNLRKLLSTALALALVFVLSVTAFAAGISKEQAHQISLNDAGYSAEEVIYIRSEYERDDGRKKWNVEFLAEEDGRYKEYDYEINAADGRITEKEWDYDHDYRGDSNLSLEDRIEIFFAKLFSWLISLFGEKRI